MKNKIKIMRRKYYLKNKETILKKNEEYSKTEKGKLVEIAAKKKYRASLKGKIADRKTYLKFKIENPLKYKARYKTRNAIRDNKINREPCFVCGEYPTQAHHRNYEKPLEIEWLCHLHHNNVHGKKL